MNVRGFSISAVLLLLFCGSGGAAPYPSSRSGAPSDDLGTVLRQLKTGLADLKYGVNNHETEIRMFEDKLRNQETSFDHLRQQLTDDFQSQRDLTRSTILTLENKIGTLEEKTDALETLTKGLTADLRQLKQQANDSVTVLGQYKQKLTDLEGLLQTQNQHMHNLEVALNSMMDFIQTKEAPQLALSGNAKTYKVQAGDTLEKIARAQKVSVQGLREANQLTNDRIIVGQTLKIPL